MKRTLAMLFAFTILFASCDRRPVQKDVVPEHNTTAHSTMDYSHMQSSPQASSAPYELQFLDGMIKHHEAAIDMALLVETRAQHAELKAFAKSILAERRKDAEQSRKLRDTAFAGMDAAVNMDFPGMRFGMKQIELGKLDLLKENAFDLEFVKQMILLDEGSMQMARNSSPAEVIKPDAGQSTPGTDRTVGAEVNTFADAIIKTRGAEIMQMREWQTAWKK